MPTNIRSPTAAPGAFHELGAELAITYVNEKTKTYVEPLARAWKAPIFMPLDVAKPGELEAVFARISKDWGRLDIALHSIAFAPKSDLQGGLLDCSAEGFKVAMDVSCHSFVRMAKLAAPLMKDGGSLFAMSYYGAQKVVSNYNVMGPVKAALEACCRYLAYELGPQKIRVHAISPGPLKTRAASGLKDFDLLLTKAARKRRSASWWTSWTSDSPARIWRRRTRGASPATPCTSTAASTSWLESGT